jgi:hypothetical protein
MAEAIANEDDINLLIDGFKTKLDISNDFPFLNHEPTIDFIKNSKVYQLKKF